MNAKRSVPVLVADDSPDDYGLLELAFQRTGYPCNLKYVRSGNEALRYLRGEGVFSNRAIHPFPKFIITDLKMTDGDGMQLLQELRGDKNLCILPAIVLSGSGDDDDVKKCMLLGAVGYFVKRHALSETTHLAKAIYEFMELAEHPRRSVNGKLLPTESKGKLGERYDDLACAPKVA